MSKVKYVSCKLGKIFDFSISSNSNLTKTFVQRNKGDVPVYGSTKTADEVSYGYIMDNLEGIKYFDDCLTINRNGSAGYIFYRKEHFCINEDVTPLIILEKYREFLDKYYLLYIIQKITIGKFNHINKAGKTFLKEIEIPIPITDNGMFDLEKQHEIARQYQIINNKKKILRIKQREIKKVQVNFLKGINTVDIEIKYLFTPKLGNGEYTKERCLKIPGKYPVYSGNTVSNFSMINEYTYDGEYLTWAKDGLAGYLMYHNEKFAITNHRGILVPTDKCVNIDLNYIKVVLEPIFRKNIKGRLGIEEKNEYTTLSKDMIKRIDETIPIPVKIDGTFDLNIQREIAKKYQAIENIKNSISKKINELLKIDIVFD